MGRSAKAYKKPTLKEKQQVRKARSSLTAQHLDNGVGVRDWSGPSATIRVATAAMRRSTAAPAQARPQARKRGDADEEEGLESDGPLDDDDEENAIDGKAASEPTATSTTGSGSGGKKKRTLLRARTKSSQTAAGGGGAAEVARTPRDQGIDYLNLWAGRKKEIASARIKQGLPLKK